MIGACLLLPLESRGQNPVDPIAALATRGMELVTAERYDEAIRVYLEAYALEPLAAILYNIAFIYDKKLNAPKKAANYYQQYIDAPDADDEGKLRAYARLRTLETQIRLSTPPPLPSPPPGISGQAIGGWIATGTGAALLITGTTFSALAHATHNEFMETDDSAARRVLRDEGEFRAVMGDVTLSVGVAAVAAGLTLLLWTEDAHDARARPNLVYTGQGMGIEGRF